MIVLKRIATGLSWLLLVFLVAAALAVRAQSLDLLTVQTGSMRPGIDPGDVVAVKSVPLQDLAVGDVITFTPESGDYSVTHRLVSIDVQNNSLTTKGDANSSPDEPITSSQVAGKVAYVLPFAGYAASFIQQPIGLLAVVYLPSLIILVAEIRRLGRHFKKMQPYLLPSSEPDFKRQPSTLGKVRQGLAHLTIFGLVIAGFSAPAWASLFDQATLSGNTISVINPNPQPNISTILLRRLEFSCSLNNTDATNVMPKIQIYNTTKQTVDISGWRLESSGGQIVEFPQDTVIKRRRNAEVLPYLVNGLVYSGDYLALFDEEGVEIDAISWGADSSRLDPALAAGFQGRRFKRVPKLTDFDLAADWNATRFLCPKNPQNPDHPPSPGDCWFRF